MMLYLVRTARANLAALLQLTYTLLFKFQEVRFASVALCDFENV